MASHTGYVTVGLYEDGTPGELFITMSKEGSTVSGLMDTIASSVSLALQYGVPLQVLVERFSHMRFEPSGFTGNPNIPIAKSIVDYIFRWLGQKYLKETEVSARGEFGPSEPADDTSHAGASGARDLRQPSRRPALPRLRRHHRARRCLLRVRPVRSHHRLRLTSRLRQRCALELHPLRPQLDASLNATRIADEFVSRPRATVRVPSKTGALHARHRAAFR